MTSIDLSRMHKRTSHTTEVESATTVDDPYRLRTGYKTPEELSNTSKKRTRQFYEIQNDNIDRLLLPVDEHVRLAREQQGRDQLKVKIATWGSLAANVTLAIVQIYSAVSSGSLSLFATMADAVFDPLSNVNLMFWHRQIEKVDGDKYPSGKARIETVGNILFCWIMTALSCVLIAISAIEIKDGVAASKAGNPPDETFHVGSIVAVAVAFVVKLCLFIYCLPLAKRYSQIRILLEDHRNDLFINGFGILTSSAGSKLRWWIDPAGAIVLSLVIIVRWGLQAKGEFLTLIGQTADTNFLQWITYIAMTHSSRVKAVDTVRAYHSGPRLIIEVDIVVDEHETVREAHDVAEELQMKLESLPDVERAYVHIDYETTHKPEHFLKKVL